MRRAPLPTSDPTSPAPGHDPGDRRGGWRNGGRRGWRNGWRRRAGTAVVSALLVCAPLPALAQQTVSLASPVRWGQGPGWSDSSSGNSGDSGYSGGWGGSGGSGTGSTSSAATVDSDPASTAESTGVVLIDTVLNGGQGAGTGIVLTAGGQVLTNYHVVEGATEVTVTLATSGKTYEAEVVGHSASADVALLQLEGASGLTPAKIDDDTAGVGDEVTAVGNAGGTGTLTAADGTITALESTITTASEYGVSGETLHGLIETDADVVAGDSGGPLVDAEGEVVGIDTAASSGSEIDGYAIPIDDALAVVSRIRSGAEGDGVQVGAAGFLGVQLSADPGSGSYGSGWGGASEDGALVAGVEPGTAAAAAGLAAGDVVTSVDGAAISSATDLSSTLGATDAGDRVRVTWTDTSGATRHATVTLGSNPAA